VNTTEPYFAILGTEVRTRTARAQILWTRLALGEGPGERVFAVVLGYAVVGSLLALYLNILTVGNARSAGRAVRNAVRQQLLVLKVATFIFIELVTFPLACGIVLDTCTVWLFPEANIHSRVAFFFQAPLTAMFYHWVAGTLFMYVTPGSSRTAQRYSLRYAGTPLLFYSPVVALSCVQEQCGSSRTLRTRMRIQSVIFLTVQPLPSFAKSV